MATAFAVMAKPEVKTVRDASETHDLIASGDEHNRCVFTYPSSCAQKERPRQTGIIGAVI